MLLAATSAHHGATGGPRVLWRRKCRRHASWSYTAANSVERFPRLFLALGCCLYLSYFVSSQLHEVAIDTCKLSPYRRDLNPDNVVLKDGGPLLPRGVRDFLFFWVIRFLLFTLWGCLIYHSNNKIGVILSVILVIGGYFVGITIVEELKLRSKDQECHTAHPNGFSGHAFYGVWALCTLYYYFVHLVNELLERKEKPRMRWDKVDTVTYTEGFNYSVSPTGAESVSVSSFPEAKDCDASQQLREELTKIQQKVEFAFLKPAAMTVAIVAILCIFTQLFYTYLYGYHSIRQMLLAASIGALYCSLISLLSQVQLLALRQLLSNRH